MAQGRALVGDVVGGTGDTRRIAADRRAVDQHHVRLLELRRRLGDAGELPTLGLAALGQGLHLAAGSDGALSRGRVGRREDVNLPRPLVRSGLLATAARQGKEHQENRKDAAHEPTPRSNTPVFPMSTTPGK